MQELTPSQIVGELDNGGVTHCPDLAPQKRQRVQAIDLAGDTLPHSGEYRGHEIDLADELAYSLPPGDLPWPAYEHGNADQFLIVKRPPHP